MSTNPEQTKAERLAEIATFMQESAQVNPLTLYCQITGKPMGRLYQEEIESLIDLDADIEESADDLLVRTLASMRPSICWNVMRIDSLEELRKSRPRETLAYLLNRLFQQPDNNKLPLAARLNDLHNRIKLYRYLESMPPFLFGNLFAMLIELDAKINLSQQRIDLDAAKFVASPSDSMTKIITWYEKQVERYKHNQQRELEQSRWMKGNTIARPAFLSTWLEHKPESKTAKVKRVKKQEDAQLAALFRSVMAESEDKPKDFAAAPTAATPAKVAKPKGTTRLPAFLRKGAKS